MMSKFQREFFLKTHPGHCRIAPYAVALSVLIFLLANACHAQGRATEPPLGSAHGEHIVILGGGFAERLQYFGYFEALLIRHANARELVIRNMGWSGDEVALMPRPYNFIVSAGTGAPDDPYSGNGSAFTADADHRILTAHLESQKTDTIFLCFGANESFKGKGGLEKFAADYQKLIDHLLDQQFNGQSPPRLLMVSPLAQEKLSGPFSDPRRRNEDLERYTGKIAEIAKENDLFFVDLFAPTHLEMNRTGGKPLTIEGLQLNSHGQRVVAEALTSELGIKDPWSDEYEPLRKLVVEKNKQFFFRWRPINGEYVFGRRRTPFGVVSFPPEMEQLDNGVAELEQRIHVEAKRLNPQP
jgi:lysophospholipase L1-like esterase